MGVRSQHPAQFPVNLPLRGGGLAGEKADGLGVGHTHPALIHNALRFLFDFGKDHAPVSGNAVAAQPQLFLVLGLFQRAANHSEIIGVVIQIRDAAVGEGIRLHVCFQNRHQCSQLRIA